MDGFGVHGDIWTQDIVERCTRHLLIFMVKYASFCSSQRRLERVPRLASFYDFFLVFWYCL